MRCLLFSRIALLTASLAVVPSVWGADKQAVQDIAYGPVLYQFHQNNFFSAITELQAAQHKGLLTHHANEAELLLGGLYLSYGMQRSAEEIFNRLLDQEVQPSVRNKAWLRLANIYYERGYSHKAQTALEHMDSDVSGELDEERAVLAGLILLQRQSYAEAGKQLKGVDKQGKWRTYARYNLAVEQLSRGVMEDEGKAILEDISHMDTQGDEEQALISDKAAIALGYYALQNQSFEQAKHYFESVSLEGPFVSQAMLGLGWAEYGQGQQEAALAVWMRLLELDSAEPSVQEALLAVPYGFNQLGAYQQAYEYYSIAIERYSDELNSIENILTEMEFSHLIKSVVDANEDPEAGWYWRADVKPDDEVSPYLFQLLASHEFQEALKQYRDVLFLQRYLQQRITDLEAYESMIDVRKDAYEARLPNVKKTLSTLENNEMWQRRDYFSGTIDAAEADNNPLAFASVKEQQLLNKLEQVAERMKRIEGGLNIDAQKNKYRILKGNLLWQLETEFPQRLWDAKKSLNQLDEVLAESREQQETLSRILNSGHQDHEAYRTQVQSARSSMIQMRLTTFQLAAAYEQELHTITTRELFRLKERLLQFKSQALFAAAQIPDRAAFDGREEQ